MPASTGRNRTKNAVTVSDVARYAEVSTAVVSYVINDGPRAVAPATAERVRGAIAALGYRPNSHARALRSGTTRILGLVLPGTGNPFFGEYNDVVYDIATRHGLALLTANSAGKAQTEHQLIDDLAARNVDGILSITSMTTADVPALRQPGLPLLLANCPFPVPGIRTLAPNAGQGTRLLIEHLVHEHGHRSVAVIVGETGESEPDDRERGWREALQANGLTGESAKAAFTMRGGYEAARTLLTSGSRPTAIFVSSDLQALGALHAIHDEGLRIPDDVAVVSFDGTEQSAHTWPPLTVVRQPLELMAEAAISALISEAPPTHTLFDMQLIIRQSCGCRSSSAL